MDGFEPRYELSMRATLIEFAVYDNHLLLPAFLRRCLLFVYADAAALVYRPHLQRSLALRLLANAGAVSERFMAWRLQDLRSVPTAEPPPDDYSDHVLHLGRRAQAGCRTETLALTRMIRREDCNFEVKGSAFDPLRYSLCLERALQEAVLLSPLEMDVVFRSWADAFAQVVRGTYLRYIEVLSAWPEMMLQTHQDFVDTWPLSLNAQGTPAGAEMPATGIRS
jgi:hypothetical protein